MGRKRGFGHDDSSDDDFQPPTKTASGSPVSSRLKRSRRASARVRRNGSSSSAEENQQEDDSDSDVMFVPESSAEGPQIISETPVKEEHKKSQTSKETSKETENNRVCKLESKPESTAVLHNDEVAADTSNEGPLSGCQSDAENPGGKRVRKASAVDRSSFDEDSSFESDVSKGDDDNDDDDGVYNSQEDEPDSDEEEIESDYEPSPGKTPSTKKAAEGSKRTAVSRERKPVPTGKQVKVAAGNNSKLGGGKNAKAADENAKKKGCSPGATGKKRLGARMPSTGSILKSSSSQGRSQGARPKGRLGSAKLRAGLSRNAAIPRLHSYLQS